MNVAPTVRARVTHAVGTGASGLRDLGLAAVALRIDRDALTGL
jgi:hypothetical protein